MKPQGDLGAAAHQTSAADAVAGIGRAAAPRELSAQPAAADALQTPDWDRIAALEEFRGLLRAKARFIVPACVFFLVYYFALPVLVGYAPDLMATPVFGVLNVAYLFALSQFLMAWVIAGLYVRAAANWDRTAAGILLTAEAFPPAGQASSGADGNPQHLASQKHTAQHGPARHGSER
jgi:uncharacterized membrane protein (DUF485 family)